MIAEAGLAALWLAAGLAAYQLVLMLLALRSGTDVVRPMRAVAVAQGALTLIAFAMLLLVFARSDMSVKLVFENSHSAKPFIYKVAGAWGNHEGSMLMWVTILAVAGAFVALMSRRTSERTLAAALGSQAVLALGFYAFLLIASNPFARLFPAPPDGQGLNPLLQDPGLAFHPPTLYLGYVGLSVAFSLAVGALLTGEVDSRLARAMRPWVLAAWVLLTLGITAGSYWAYYELGWGGYWFWDPVENASLMPWLAATALLHSINVLAARGALKAWTMMLAVIAFSMSMVGTFLVRSGILTSVHAFAIDPERGTFLLALLAIYVGAAFVLFAARGATLKEGAPFELVSRESGLVINNLLLSVILGIVFLGTLYPLFVEAVSGEKLSVGAPYFNSVAGPLALLLAVLVGIGPLLSWRRERRPVLGHLKLPALLGASALAITIFLAPAIGILPRIGFAVAAFLAAASILPLIVRNPLRAPLATWGMVVAHFGIAVALTGMAANAAFSSERLAIAKPGEILTVGPWQVQLADVTPAAGPNYTALEGELRATRNGRVITLNPQTHYYSDPVTQTNESAIRTFWNGQLYTVLGNADESGGWQLRLWWKPFVTLIWAGGALIALGGAVALLGRLTRRRRRREPDWRERHMSRGLRLIPIILLVWLVIGLAWRLARPADTAIPSQMVERPAPQFQLPSAIAGRPGIASADLATGQPRLVNIFASWCVPCTGEAPVLRELQRRGVRIDGIAVRDTPEALNAFLARNGDPYERIGADRQSAVQIALGSSGVPETFVVDGRGVIRRQYIGPLNASNIPGMLSALGQVR